MNAVTTRAGQRAAFAMLGTVALAGGLLLGSANVAAHAEHGHPARIHNGSCEELGGVAFRLNGVGGSVDDAGAPVATPAAVNPESSYQVMVSTTLLDAPLSDIVDGAHAVMIYDDDDAMAVIACGNIGGAMMGDELITGLAEARIPGHLGFAIFAPEGDQTEVTVIVGHAMAPVSASSGMADDHGDEADAHDDGDDHDEATEAPNATPAP